MMVKFLPALVGAIGAILLDPPKTRWGMLAVWVVSVGFGAWLGPPLTKLALTAWLGSAGCMLVASGLGLVALKSVARGIEGIDWPDSWPFSKKE